MGVAEGQVGSGAECTCFAQCSCRAVHEVTVCCKCKCKLLRAASCRGRSWNWSWLELELAGAGAGAPSPVRANPVQSATPSLSSNHHSVVLPQLGTRMSRDTRSCQSGSPISVSIDAPAKHRTSKTTPGVADCQSRPDRWGRLGRDWRSVVAQSGWSSDEAASQPADAVSRMVGTTDCCRQYRCCCARRVLEPSRLTTAQEAFCVEGLFDVQGDLPVLLLGCS